MIVRNPAYWQRCIHGPETMLREEVCEQLLAVSGPKAAFRYAACGLADTVRHDGESPKISPMGCGHRLCPRCGRQRGRPMIQRIFGWLAAEPHEDIFSMVLTQRVRRGETVKDARARMRTKEHEYLLVLKEKGMLAGASCAHVVWSEPGGGWHYHVHLLLELPTGEWTCDDLRELYLAVASPEVVQVGEGSARLVVGAGPADPRLLEQSVEPDFWSEHRAPLARAVQYPVRDIAQGISAVRCGGHRERVRECVAVLLKHARGWKLRRTFGRWRKKPPVPVAVVAQVETPAEPAPKVVGVPKPVQLGTVHRCYRLARKGSTEMRVIFHDLEATCRNDTEFGRRFVAFCRIASSGFVT